jgi:hypothetical protein
MATCDNDRFLRLWHEIEFDKVGLKLSTLEEASACGKKWVPYNKGGKSLKWYGNNDYLLNWEDDGRELKEFAQKLYGTITRTIQNMPFYFKECLTWSLISTTDIAFRFRPKGSVFDKAGMSCFADENLYQLLALCNSKITPILLEVLAPTINCQAGDVAEIPVLPDVLNNDRIEFLTRENIDIAREEWDDSETSWDFKKHPLV